MRSSKQPDLLPGVVLGVLIGTLLGYLSASSDAYFVSNETILGAIVGAFIAGGMSVCTQLLIFRDNNRQREIADRDAKRTLLQGLFISLLGYLDDVHKLHNYYRTFERSDEVYINGEAVLKKPLQATRISFSLDRAEKAAVIELREPDFLNSLIEIERMSIILAHLEKVYVESYEAFDKFLRSAGQMSLEGRSISTVAQGHPLQLLEVTDPLNQLRNALKQALPQAKAVLARSTELLGRYDRTITLDLREDLSGGADFLN